MVQHWLTWSIVAALLMLGAWMRMGAYLFFLGLAAILALVEAACGARLFIQIVSFVAASCVLALVYAVLAYRARGKKPGG